MQERSEEVSPSAVCPEMRALLYLAGSHRDPGWSSTLAAQLLQDMNWDLLLKTALNHGVFPLLYRNLKLHATECASLDVREKLRRMFLSNAVRNHQLTLELLQILELFDAHHIPAMPFKGPALAASAYGDVALRQFDDLDLLIHRDDAPRARQVLAERGYISPYGLTRDQELTVIRYQKHFLLVSRTRHITTELHWTVEPIRNCLRFCDEHIWVHPGTVCLEGKTVPALSPEDTLVLLCLHGASHCWERLGWICDVAEHVARTPDLDWELVEDRARDLGCSRMLFLGFRLAGELVDARLPESVAQTARNYPGADGLAQQVVQRLLFRPNDSSGTWSALRFRLAARESLRDKVRFTLERFVIPDAGDCQFWRLPANLSFLLFALRPLRLMTRAFTKDGEGL